MDSLFFYTLTAAILSGCTPMPLLSAENPGARSEAEPTQKEEYVEPEPARDVDESLQILKETGELLDRVEEMRVESGGRATEELLELESIVAFQLRRLDLVNTKLPEGVLLSDEELIERAIKGIQVTWPHMTRERIIDLPPKVEWRSGGARVTFPVQQRPEGEGGFRGPEFRFEVDLHPATGGILMIGLPN